MLRVCHPDKNGDLPCMHGLQTIAYNQEFTKGAPKIAAADSPLSNKKIKKIYSILFHFLIWLLGCDVEENNTFHVEVAPRGKLLYHYKIKRFS